jgi:hypothetical protein
MLWLRYVDDVNVFHPNARCMLQDVLSRLSSLNSDFQTVCPALPEKKVVGMERGPLSLVSTTEELFDRKVAAPV